MTSRLVKMAKAINAKLPSDTYASTEEWKLRYSERLQDAGYTPTEIHASMRATLEQAELRDQARTELKARLSARAPTEEGYDLLLALLIEANVFISLRPGRNLARYAQHIKYFGARSRTIKAAYHNVFHYLRQRAPAPPIQELFNASLGRANVYAKLYSYRWWGASPNETHAFYEVDSFVTCPLSKLTMPRNVGIQAITDERGLTKTVHPSLLADGRIVRDGPSGLFLLVGAVECITLDSGEQAWRRHNEAAGLIFFDEDEQAWRRNNTNGAIASYHGGRREWRDTDASRYRGCIGVELEVGFKTRGHQTKFLNRFVDERGRFLNNRPFLIEADSSLSGITGGSEIISEPLKLFEGYQSSTSQWRWLLAQLSSHGAEGWKHRNKAGIHVNMDVSDKRPNQIMRFVAFMNNAASLSRFIAGRKYIFGAGAETSDSHLDDTALTDVDAFIASDKHASGGGYAKIDEAFLRQTVGHAELTSETVAHYRRRGKYQPVHIRPGNVLEVRIFGSNLRYEGFMACVEYCVAGMEFACQLSSDTAAMHPEIGAQFREWLAGNVEQYPNLAARIGVIATGSTSMVAARPLLELVA